MAPQAVMLACGAMTPPALRATSPFEWGGKRFDRERL